MSRLPYEKPAIVVHRGDIANDFGRSAAHRVVGDIDGVPVRELVARHGSPLLVFSERTLRARIAEVRDAFRSRYPRVRFAWSYKTNYLDAICGIFHQEGWDAEVVSELEYDMARRLGVPGANIVCNGAWKPRSWLRRAIADGALLQIDHFDELESIEQVLLEAPGPGRWPLKVALRVNLLAEALGTIWERFGFNLENGEALDAARRVCGNPALRLGGLHCHLGTFITLPEAYRQAARKLGELAREIEGELAAHIETLNLGGGFPSNNSLLGGFGEGEDDLPPIGDFAAAICDELKEAYGEGGAAPELVLESGRALVDQAGSLLCTVVGTRRLQSGERGLVLDAGVNVLYTAHWYRHRAFSAQEVPGRAENTTLHGPLCMNIDVLRRSLPLPPLSAGHHLVLRPVGAYNVTQWMQFSQPRPAVVMVGADGGVAVLRRAETLEDVKGCEALPERYAPPRR